MPEIPTLRQIYEKLGCQEKTAGGVCWFECNTSADKAVILFHGVTGGKIDMVPLAERYVNFGYAVYAIDLPGHGGSVQPPLNTYDARTDAGFDCQQLVFFIDSLSCAAYRKNPEKYQSHYGLPDARSIAVS